MTCTIRNARGSCRGKLAVIGAIAGVLGAVAAASTVTSVASATLAKGTPVAITTTRAGGGMRSFTFTSWPRGSAAIVHRGFVVRTVASRGATAGSRQVQGTEVLEGPHGTLTLLWSGTQTRGERGWGTATGRWRLVGKTGAYAGCSGRGTFSSDTTFGAVHYRGMLITAQ